MSKRIGMVAGEPSGDLLAGRIIAGLQAGDASVRCEASAGRRCRPATSMPGIPCMP